MKADGYVARGIQWGIRGPTSDKPKMKMGSCERITRRTFPAVEPPKAQTIGMSFAARTSSPEFSCVRWLLTVLARFIHCRAPCRVCSVSAKITACMISKNNGWLGNAVTCCLTNPTRCKNRSNVRRSENGGAPSGRMRRCCPIVSPSVMNGS